MNKNDIDNCKWLKTDNKEWTMTSDNNKVYSYNNGLLESSIVTEELFVRPVIFLSEKTEILKGKGTKDNPYIIIEEKN